MFYEIYNVQKKHSKLVSQLTRILLLVLYRTHVINGYCRYGTVEIEEGTSKYRYYIKLEEVAR